MEKKSNGYLSFETDYTEYACNKYQTSDGIQKECWGQIVLKKRLEAIEIWKACGGYDPGYYFQQDIITKENIIKERLESWLGISDQHSFDDIATRDETISQLEQDKKNLLALVKSSYLEGFIDGAACPEAWVNDAEEKILSWEDSDTYAQLSSEFGI